VTWHQQAACNGHEEEFADADVERHGNSRNAGYRAAVKRAKAICAGCPVVAACYERVMDEEGHDHYTARWSVRAGLEPMERARLAGVRHSGPVGRPSKRITHGTSSGARAHRYQGEEPCDLCRNADNAARRERAQRERVS
jgi:hypothetical protein